MYDIFNFVDIREIIEFFTTPVPAAAEPEFSAKPTINDINIDGVNCIHVLINFNIPLYIKSFLYIFIIAFVTGDVQNVYNIFLFLLSVNV